MKNSVKKYFSIILIAALIHTNITNPMKAISKGIEIAGHIGTAVDTAMGIATVGVTLWGSDADRARMEKANMITSIATSLARGDLAGAQSAAEAVRGSQKESFVYQPLSADALADADIVPADNINRRSLGDKTPINLADLVVLRAHQKIVSIDDLKVIQFPEAKNQLVFLATDLPQSANQSKLYRLLNGTEILMKTESIQNNIAHIVINKLVNGLFFGTAVEIGRIKCSVDQLKKGLFVGTTNGELSIFFKEDNVIKKTILIQNMNQ